MLRRADGKKVTIPIHGNKEIPKGTLLGILTDLDISKEEFLRAVKAAGLFTQAGVNGINLRLRPEENLLEISSQNTQTGENASSLSVSGNGVAGAIVFDYRYLSDGLNTIDQDDVALALNESTSPGVLRAQGKDDYIYIIMPIRS